MFKLSKGIVDTINRFFTNAYKAVGFVILLVILVGLVSYFVLNAFYISSDRWIAPIILTASHEKVIELNSELASHLHQRDKLLAERKGLEAELDAEARFRDRFKDSLQLEIESTEKSKDRVLGVLGQYDSVYRQADKTAEGFVDSNEDTLDQELEANLIDREQYYKGQWAVTSSKIDSVQRQENALELREEVEAYDRRLAALRAVATDSPATSKTPLTYDVLTIQSQYESSIVETKRLEAGIEMIDTAIERYEKLLNQIKTSPYLRAMDERVHLAFVPYDNLDQAKTGSAVYGCRLPLLVCSEVGTVTQVVDGEITARHPLYSEQLRGQMVEIDLEDSIWAEEKALFLNRPALLF